MECVIGIDLGGTTIKLGAYLVDGTCQGTIAVPTPQPSTPPLVLEAIIKGIRQLPSSANAQAIGLGIPGPVDRSGKIAKVCINLDGWQGIPLGLWLEQRTNLPTILANDANCAGMGEAWLGAGKGVKDLILLTLGTGVGGAIVLDGHLFTGRDGAAGELGLMSINFDGYGCNSGNYGSLEQYCSIRGLTRLSGHDPA
ncbi:MAG: ROK family protein, partial [Synechococcaceae cyanobacterium RL_1_2]|nr:ROK family protein [Synechococcaceae cyanobacterium RL_1_2]